MKKLAKFIIIILIVLMIFLITYSLKDIILKKIYVIKYSEYVEKYSSEYDVDEYLVYAIIKAESNFNEKAESAKGAKGLMQLMYTTAEEIAKNLDVEITEDSVLDPEINIMLGTNYIAKLIQKYDSIALALAAYNAGSGKVDSWIKENTLKEDGSNIENVPYKETNNYIRKILNDYEIYQKLYEEE